MKMTFFKLFLIGMFKDSNLAEKLPNLAENLFKSWALRSSWSSFFPSLVPPTYPGGSQGPTQETRKREGQNRDSDRPGNPLQPQKQQGQGARYKGIEDTPHERPIGGHTSQER